MKRFLAILTAAVLTFAAAAPACAAGGSEITVSKDRISHDVADTLYGIFIEDISYACDGGLVSQMVNNGSFEYAPKQDAGWVFEGVNAETGTDKPLNAQNPTYAVLNVEGECTVRNIGFPELYIYKTYEMEAGKNAVPDMGFKQGVTYDFSCYVKNLGYRGGVEVYLDSPANAAERVALDVPIADTWTKITAKLPSAATEDGGLALTFTGKGRLAIDFVSLVPENAYGYGEEAWKYTTLRPDLYEALKDLSPAFVRFPGGCLAEGTDVNNLYNWKKTVGPLEARPQAVNLWEDPGNGRYYNNTSAMGYHEYFQLCEDLGAEAIPVVNAAMTCQARNGYNDHVIADWKIDMTADEWRSMIVDDWGWDPNNEQAIVDYTNWIDSLGIRTHDDFEAWLDTVALRPGTEAFSEYTQDLLDLVEYANGDASTKWGAVRAKNGHPAPFNIHYLAIGNENWGDLYFRNFDALYKAVKKVYPDLTIVSTAGAAMEGTEFDRSWNEINEKYADCIVDEHYYTRDGYLFDHNDRYDGYDRSGAGVFVGEYAVTASGIGTMETKNNLLAALEEASFLTGLERNGDVVKMASYAPTFAKVNANSWDYNLIWFDSQEAVLTPDYYVQMLYSNNTGTKYIDTDFSADKLWHSVTVDEDERVIYAKFVNTGAGRSVTLNLDGFEEIGAVTVQTLQHDYLAACNEVGKLVIAPQEAALKTDGRSVTAKLKKNSITVVRIPYGGNDGESVYRLPHEYKPEFYIPIKYVLIYAGIALGCAAVLTAVLLTVRGVKRHKRKKRLADEP